MTELANTVAAEFANRFESIAAKQFWRNRFLRSSARHSMLHSTGNLSYYLGVQIAGSGYVRDRHPEFTEAARPLKGRCLAEF